MTTLVKQDQEDFRIEEEIGPKQLERRKWIEVVEGMAEEIDPWDVSVASLADQYRTSLPDIGADNLELPGRMVWACAFFLRLKAEMLEERGDEAQFEEGFSEPSFDELFPYQEFETESYIPSLSIPLKRAPRARPTTGDLEAAFRRAKRDYQKRVRDSQDSSTEDTMDWGVDFGDQEGIRAKLNNFFQFLKDQLREKKRIIFSQLVEGEPRKEKLDKFVQLLHLKSEGKVECTQDRPFGEIKISLTDEQA